MSLLDFLKIAATGSDPKVVAPTITNPEDGAEKVPLDTVFNTSAFKTVGGFDRHVSTDWELATDPNFENIVASSYNNTEELTEWDPEILEPSEAPAVPDVADVTINRDEDDEAEHQVLLMGTQFDSSTGDTHHSTDWEISTDPNFENIVFSSYYDETNKDMIEVHLPDVYPED